MSFSAQQALQAAAIESLIVEARGRNIALPTLHDAQQRIVSEARRFNVVDCGRRFGKSVLARWLAVEDNAIPVGLFYPTYKMLVESWRDLKNTLQPITARKSEQEKRIELVTGGFIECWSLDAPDSVRGRAYGRVLIDEAAMIPALMDAWNMVIQPTLIDLKGDAWFFSTPKGKNGFWKLYNYGLDPTMENWACWQMPTSANPYIDDEEIENIKRGLPALAFSQEILAEFVDDGAGVFRCVTDCTTAEPQSEPIAGHSYAFGVDWGKHNDFTVITIMDTTLNAAVQIDRFNQIDYRLQLSRLKTYIAHLTHT